MAEAVAEKGGKMLRTGGCGLACVAAGRDGRHRSPAVDQASSGQRRPGRAGKDINGKAWRAVC